jgi:cytochrome b pre-mRNA-processing protein 3
MLKQILSIFRRRPEPIEAAALYRTIILQSRKADFYSRLEVPDTLDGRFDMIVLHAFLVMRRLNQCGPKGLEVSQSLFDLMFADMDSNLREIGVGDLSVGKKVKRMAQGFYGRVDAYEAGLKAQDGATLKSALARNLFGTIAAPSEHALEAVTAYVRRADAALFLQPDQPLLAGNVDFPPPLW